MYSWIVYLNEGLPDVPEGPYAMQTILLFLVTFFMTLLVSSSAGTGGDDMHVQDAYPAIAFFAGVVVAVLGFLLKFFVTRDRQSVDRQFTDLEERITREINLLHKHMEHMETKQKGYVDGIGVKVERNSEVIEEKILHAVDELRRHDRELFQKWDALNREFGQLKGEHDTLREQHHRNWKGHPAGNERRD